MPNPTIIERPQIIQQPGPVLVEPVVRADHRGYFVETWNADRYSEHGLPAAFSQDNVSHSVRGVLLGLHYQHPRPQGKLVCVMDGEIFDVAVDIRVGSPTFGRWYGAWLSSDNHRQLYVPEGFAHGFCVMSREALVSYKCTDVYRAECDRNVAWNDPAIGIDWPIGKPRLSPRDAAAPRLDEIGESDLPVFSPMKNQPAGCRTTT